MSALPPEDVGRVLASIARPRLAPQQETVRLFECSEVLLEAPLTVLAGGWSLNDLVTEVGSFFGLDIDATRRLRGLDTLGLWAEAVLEAWGDSSPILTFKTSGSTGAPTLCPTPLTLLKQEAREALAPLFSDRARILAFVPRHHIYGFLFTVLLPRILGIPVREEPPVPLSSLLKELRAGDLCVAFPMFWSAASRLRTCFSAGVFGATSTGPCPPYVIESLLHLGLERMTEVYGSSETGGIGARHDHNRPYSLFPYWTQVREDGYEGLVRSSPEGGMMKGVPLPDNLEWLGPDRFNLRGRRDNVVQVAGHNVNLQTVEDTMRRHPIVLDCVVRLMRPNEGNRLKAFVVPSEAVQPTFEDRQRLNDWLRGQLPAHSIPKSIRFGQALPMTALGKLRDWEISRKKMVKSK